ncbi:hypothetical protein [Cellulomonas phragmiteti]|uniref:Lipoprotein LpqB beta-propeller domain-containing protein n=1 Tax=Cellulomonas phragmiteti TaxID=478780 RepID=A0ABQ4DNH9_9CELL|nr:hypothetical protein [Cellulomonas phragmiteti]GIG40907.1 hypothetical protein Cph01nite_26690 [Cellulomonas phragmiteti]
MTTDDLTARLERALGLQEQHEGDVRPDAAALADLHDRVARGRRGRLASHAAVAAAVVGVLGVAGWFGLQARTVPQPAHTPTPSVTAAPTPAPTPAPSAVASAAPLEPVALPGLPPMFRAPEGLLEQTGPGWFLLAYASGLYEPPAGDGERHALVVSAPTGELYHLLDVAPGGVTPVRWSAPGTARAVVWDGQGESRVGTVDLRTGDVVVDDRLPASAEWVGMSGADELWLAASWDDATDGTLHVLPAQGPGRRLDVALWSATVAPDGRTVVGAGPGGVVEAVDVATGRRTTPATPPGQTCHVVGWLDATGVMASCVDPQPDPPTSRWNHDEHGGQVVRLDVTGGPARTLTTLGPDGVVPWTGQHVRDGVLVASSAPLLSSTDCYEFCYGGAYLWTGSDVREVTTSVDLGDDVCEVRAGGAGLLLRTGDLCYEETTGSQWWTVEEATGATRLVGPAVESDLGIGAYAAVERS